ncbi:MAG: hypothetical protein DRJ65_21060, partial [Acidobacteria bacterium]
MKRKLTICFGLVSILILTAGCREVNDDNPVDTLQPPAVKIGLDRVAAGHTDIFRDKHIGLIVHAASVTGDGRHAIDVFQGADLNVVRLLTPEHG